MNFKTFLLRYFSLQATSPLGFDDSIRMEVECSICDVKGPDPESFERSRQIVLQYIEKVRSAFFKRGSITNEANWTLLRTVFPLRFLTFKLSMEQILVSKYGMLSKQRLSLCSLTHLQSDFVLFSVFPVRLSKQSTVLQIPRRIGLHSSDLRLRWYSADAASPLSL